MNRERAAAAFSHVGDSWKLAPGSTSPGGRPVHGKYGRGRYAAFSLGSLVRWISTSEALAGAKLSTIEVRGARSNLDRFEIEDIAPAGSAPGTTVEVGVITPEALAAFDEPSALRQRLLMEFALHLDRHPDFRIDFLGTEIDPATVIGSRTEIPLDVPTVGGAAKLTIIEWDLNDVERRLYLCKPGGAIVAEMPAGVQSVGAEFTAYLEWAGFQHDQHLILEGETQTPAGQVVAVGRAALRAHLAESTRRREAATVDRWKAEGVYPYRGEPKSEVERATRDAFNVVAMAASRTVDESRSQTSKALALGLLKETFDARIAEAARPVISRRRCTRRAISRRGIDWMPSTPSHRDPP